MDQYVSEDQFDFRSGRGIREAMLALGYLGNEARLKPEHNSYIYWYGEGI